MAHLERILQKLLDEIATKQSLVNYNITIKQISSEGANYTSQLFLATITSENYDNIYLFGKVAAMGDKMRSEVPFPVYEVERKVYTEIAKVYQSLEDKHNVPNEFRLKMPKFYGCNPKLKEETIVLEDLTAQGYGDYSRFKSIDWKYASKAVEELAKLHALSFAYGHEHPDEFQSLVKELMVDWQPEGDQKHFYENMLKTGLASIKEENRNRVMEVVARRAFARVTKI